MSIPVRLKVFEGPLDLLLHLIDKNKLNIYDIPIVEITDQYLQYIDSMNESNMEIMSEFIEMAATLINIKSKMLLPTPVNDDEEEVDPRVELVEKLIEYKKFKYLSNELKTLQIDAKKMLFKNPTIPEEVLNYKETYKAEDLLGNIQFEMLLNIFQSVVKKQRNKIDPIRSKFGEIKRESFTVQEKIEEIKKISHKYATLSFRDILEDTISKVEVIVTFLAILELMKTGYISVEQDDIFDDIIITFKDKRRAYAVK